MKKKSILAMMLAVSMFTGTATFTGCNLLPGNGDDGTSQTETVSVTGVSLSINSVEIAVNDTHELTATVLPSTATNKSCKWESSDPTVATVSSTGVITGKKVGVATITVTTVDGGKTDTCAVTVRSAKVENDEVKVTGVSVTPSSLKMEVNEEKSLTAKISPSNATNKNLSWSSSDPETVKVDDYGNLTALKAGSATITVTTEDGGKTATCSVTVKEPAPETVAVTGVTVNPTTLSLNEGAHGSITATVAPVDATNQNVSWSSDATAVATVDDYGNVTAVKEGTATITVTTEDGGKTATCFVTVKKPLPDTVAVTGVTVNPTTLSLKEGENGSITATVAPVDATNQKVSWSSDATAVATVDDKGNVTAVKEGTAIITVTTDDGGKTATCTVTVSASQTEPTKEYTVKFYDGGIVVHTETVTEGATVQSYNYSKPGYIFEGWTTNSSGHGEQYDFSTPVNGNLDLHAMWTAERDEFTYKYAGYECAAFEWVDANPKGAKVEYKLTGASGYTKVDDALVRAATSEKSESGAARVDIVGLKGNSNYDFKVTTSDKKEYYVNNMFIGAYDRSGYAHFGKSDGVGAYNDDGTPKSNAKIYYVTEATKNNVVDSNGKSSGKSIVEVLQNQKGGDPMIIRVIGTVGAPTWNEIKYTDVSQIAEALSACKVTDGKYLYQADLISAKINSLNKKPSDDFYRDIECAELNGLTSRATKDGDEYDSCWNDASISNAQNVTVEGIGEDARIFQWGMTFRTSSSIEVRNLTFEDYTEDACSFEGSTSETNASKMTSKNIWLHHNTIEEGKNYWDVCPEQDKHEGDGGTDFKGVANITISYNTYNQTHKTGLIGGGSTHMTANVTFHHNYYNGCKSRLPLARQANMHMYNNYYKGTTSTDISVRANGYAFVENCYFEAGNNSTVHVDLQYEDVKDSSGSVIGNRYGAAKLVGCVIDESGKHIAVNSKIDKEKSLYIGDDRQAKVTNQCSFGQNFDTDSSKFYYANGKSKVESMLTAEETKEQIPDLAGVQHRDKSVSGPTGGGTTDPDIPPVTEEQTITIIDDFTALKGNETYDIILSGDATGYLVDNKITAKKPGSTLESGTGNSLKLQSATKLNFSTASLTKTVKLVINLSSEKANVLNLTVNGGSAQKLEADSSGNIIITLQANTEYEIGRADAEALITVMSLIIG